MLKAMKTITYGYKGFDLSRDDLYKSVYKRRGRVKVLASALVELGKNAEGEAVMAMLAAFIAQIPDLLRRSLLLPTAKFYKINAVSTFYHRIGRCES